MHFTGNNGYQICLVFAAMRSSLTVHYNKKVTNWISTGIPSEKKKPFDTNLELILSNFANGKIILKFNNSVVVQKNYALLHSNFILNLYLVFE